MLRRLRLTIDLRIKIKQKKRGTELLWQGVSEKIRSLQSSVRTTFHTCNTLRKLLCNIAISKSKLNRKSIIYSFPCECGVLYFGETCRPLGVCVNKHKINMKQGKPNSSRLAEQAWKEQHKILWDNVEILAKEIKCFKV